MPVELTRGHPAQSIPQSIQNVSAQICATALNREKFKGRWPEAAEDRPKR
jgi:hypothetical protein